MRRNILPITPDGNDMNDVLRHYEQHAICPSAARFEKGLPDVPAERLGLRSPRMAFRAVRQASQRRAKRLKPVNGPFCGAFGDPVEYCVGVLIGALRDSQA